MRGVRSRVFYLRAACWTLALLAVPAWPLAVAGRDAESPDLARERRIRTLIEAGSAAEAGEEAERWLAASEAGHGPDSLATARVADLVLEARALARRHAGDGSLELAERALAARRATGGASSTDVARSLVLLARVLTEREEGRERAVPLFEEAAAIQEVELGDRSPALAATLAHHGYALLLLKRGDDAKAVLSRAVEMNESLFGRGHRATAHALHLLAYAHQLLREMDTAIAFSEEALAIRERVLPPGHIDVGDSLAAVSAFRLMTGHAEGSLTLLERARDIRRRVLGPEHPGTLDVAWNLALLLGQVGEVGRAEALYDELIATYERQGGPGNPQLQGVLRNLGGLYNSTGRLEEARDVFARALEIAEANDASPSSIGRELHNLGLVLKPLGDLAGAEERLSRALAILESTDGPRSRAVGLVLHSFGNLKLDLGEYTLARGMFERSLAIREELSGPDHESVAHSVVGVAESHWSLGDRAAARTQLERALAIYERLEPAVPGGEAYVLVQLGRLLGELGDFEGAERHLDRALRLKNVQGTAVRRGFALDAYGELRARQGHHEQALERFERSLEASEREGRHDHPDTATTQLRMASSLQSLGRFEEARPRAERALTIRRAAFGSRHPEVSRAALRLAEIDRLLGRADEAFESALSGHLESVEHVSLMLRALSERRALGYAAEAPSGLDLALTLAVESPHPERTRRAWDAVIRSRALVLDEMARRFGAVADDELDSLRGNLARARARLANLVVGGPKPEHADRYAETLDRARQASERAERAVAERSERFAEDRQVSRLGADDVTAAVSRDAALVSFVLFERLTPAVVEDGEGEPVSPERAGAAYVAIVMRGGSAEPKLVDLGSAGTIDRLVGSWRKEVSSEPSPVKAARARAEQRYRRAGEALRAAVWDPLLPSLEGARRVFLVPDGDLHLVSFATLPSRRAGYLAEHGPLVHLLSSERELASRTPAAPRGGMLAIGAPDYEARPGAVESADMQDAGKAVVVAASGRTSRGRTAACQSFTSRRFAPLPASAEEVREVARLWRRGSTAQGDARDSVRTLTGARATEGLFKRLARDHAVIHLATHGFFLDDACVEPVVAAGPSATTAEFKIAVNALRLSGLALAGGNRRAEADEHEEDGVLTAEEISALDLHGVEWVVLSACDTGLGAVRPREGVFGLRRAFRVAGASSVIMSLWSVRDEAARDWMRHLYVGRAAGLATADAVRRAQVATLGARREAGLGTHPFYWGAFVASGRWD